MALEPQRLTITTGSWVRLAGVAALVYAFFQVYQFLLGVVVSIVLASAIEPVILWARRQRIPRLPAVVAVYFLTALCLSGFFYFLLLPLIGEVAGFVKTLTIYTNSIENESILSGMFETQNIFPNIDTPAIIGDVSSYLSEFSNFLSQGVFNSLTLVSGGVISFILIIVLSFYLAVQDDGIAKFLKAITPVQHESYVTNLWHRSNFKIGRWMQGQILLGALVMLLVYVGLLIIGVPHALLLAVLAGILELIPLFGPVLAAIPAVFVAYAALGPTTALVVVGLYVVIQQLENHIIYPMVVKKVIGVPPMISIIALVIGGQLGGFLGLLVAVPIAAIIMEFIADWEKKKIVKLSEAQ